MCSHYLAENLGTVFQDISSKWLGGREGNEIRHCAYLHRVRYLRTSAPPLRVVAWGGEEGRRCAQRLEPVSAVRRHGAGSEGGQMKVSHCPPRCESRPLCVEVLMARKGTPGPSHGRESTAEIMAKSGELMPSRLYTRVMTVGYQVMSPQHPVLVDHVLKMWLT